MSVPDFTGDVSRATRLVVRGQLPGTGEEVELAAEAFEARALQHEIDHCAGLLFLDRVAGAHAIHARQTYLDILCRLRGDCREGRTVPRSATPRSPRMVCRHGCAPRADRRSVGGGVRPSDVNGDLSAVGDPDDSTNVPPPGRFRQRDSAVRVPTVPATANDPGPRIEERPSSLRPRTQRFTRLRHAAVRRAPG